MAEIQVGTLLKGFCHGAFGRDSYADKRVEAIGADWVVVRDDGGAALMYSGSTEELAAYTVNCGCGCSDGE
ncbi:hypothetical protein AB0H76_15170 [Nocardia sp. NPDC050712]|uniref:hypothetical protein n=1 Tax=Nocardia sp. NPDC050712 TaxID=3155518 RepID=UPI0033D2C43F